MSNLNNRAGYQVFNTYSPAWSKGKGGPKALEITFNFGSQSAIVFDILQELDANQIDFAQSAFIDNSQNGNAFTLIVTVTQQRIIIPAYSQGIVPIISPKQLSGIASTIAVSGLTVQIILLNVMLPYAVWSARGSNAALPSQGSFVDRSIVIAAGGTSQLIMAANSNRKRFIINNPADATNNPNGVNVTLGFGVPAVATKGIQLLPGGWFDSGSGPVDIQAINVLCSDTGNAVLAEEM